VARATTALAVGALLLGSVVGCSPSITPRPQPSSTAAACTSQISFGAQTVTLINTDVSKKLTAAKAGPYQAALHHVRDANATIVGSPDVPVDAVYAAFADHLEQHLPTLGDSYVHTSLDIDVPGPESFVLFAGVRAVSAPFEYRCGQVSGKGTVASWTIPRSGIVGCDAGTKTPPPFLADVAQNCTQG
jgi:hypothetical protein